MEMEKVIWIYCAAVVLRGNGWLDAEVSFEAITEPLLAMQGSGCCILLEKTKDHGAVNTKLTHEVAYYVSSW